MELTRHEIKNFLFLKGLIESAMINGSSILTAPGINSAFFVLRTKIFETKTVKELISGYKDPLLTMAKIFVPGVVKDDHFSLINNVSFK